MIVKSNNMMDKYLMHNDKNKYDGIFRKRKHFYKIHLANTRYDIIRRVVEDSVNWVQVSSDCTDWDVIWLDTSISDDRFRKLKKFQKINHFLGMKGITRKDELCKNLKKMKKNFPQSYNFFPPTWVLPNEISDFKIYFKKKKNKNGSKTTYIVKLKNSCQGKGIYLTKSLDNINKYESCVIQKYIHKPLLINDLKFDIRLYVLVTGCDPLRIFLHEDGLVRFSIEKYKLPKSKNLKQVNMHLTNFSINKKSDKFENSSNPDDATRGHKRSWKAFLQKLKEEGLPMDSLMKKIEHMIVKTICSIQPELKHYYNSSHISDYSNSMCFEVLGFDILLDYKLKPWLLEVNHSPSFSTCSLVDEKVKYAVIRDTLNILYMHSKYRYMFIQEYINLQKFRTKYNDLLEKHKKELKEKLNISRFLYENKNLGGYKRIYPLEELLDYENLILFVSNAWNKSIGIPYSMKRDSYEYLFKENVKRKNKTKEKLSILDLPTTEEQLYMVENVHCSKFYSTMENINISNCSTAC
ncbi:tubulin--tyrosine ligase [Plasmodium brasilianum]|uniref:Tubulin--tyrosine ligase, putative n=2 Tax=Plasmodium (Plasmodium) TaxID=418103 RepID=A0A1A8VYA9_PLAMA|nr:tubulin--tyrosine ligase, putative [Plasmodium malariae]KAI4838791.1 tubulin--tyrosine ligase [Plasmodium brasilianum]SBS84361.1 tubulin--tyrosine ligase, putative [Plasmodium malariae]SCN12131.1 tubulin--tyrosine ligase, putative [Plasmodium malariae]